MTLLKRGLLFFLLSLCGMAQAQNGGFITPDSVEILAQDCDLGASVCLEGITSAEMANFEFTVDGLAYEGEFSSCAFTTVGVYNIASFLPLAPVGPYQVNSWDFDGTVNTGNFANFEELVALLNEWDTAGNWVLDFPLLIGGQMDYEYDTLFLKSVTFNSEAALGYSTGFFPTGISILVQDGAHTIVATETTSGLSDTLLALVTCSNFVIVEDVLAINATNTFCPDISDLGSLPEVVENLFINNSNPAVNFGLLDGLGCITYTADQPGTDTACIVVCDNIGFCDTTYLIVNVVIPPNGSVFYLYDTLLLGSTRIICDPTWNDDLLTNICANEPGAAGVNFEVDPASDCVTITGVTVGATDTACIVSCPFNGPCDTTYFIVTVNSGFIPLSNVVFDTVYLSESSTNYCYFDDAATLSPICPAGQNVAFSELPNACISYSPINVGLDTACYLVCDAALNCDSLFFYITVLSAPTPDTISVAIALFESAEVCLATNETGLDLVNITTASIGDNVTFSDSIIAPCFTLIATSQGSDTLIWVLTNAAGLQDTTVVYVFVLPQNATNPNYFVDTLALGSEGILCVDVSELTGPVSGFNTPCGAPDEQIFTATFDQETNCIIYSPTGFGTDSTCFVICDTTGVCDTTYLVITVADIALAPLANPDYFSTSQDSSIFVTVLANDLQVNTNTSVLPLPDGNPSLNGTLIALATGVFQYNSPFGFCGIDSFQYQVCNGSLCDTAWVKIQVTCPDSLVIFTGISPNGDGENDTWIISGLNLIPNHTVQVYNRWGNLLYESDAYQNDWGGTFQNSDLPDHAYFYLVLDRDTGKNYSGWLQLYR